MKIQPIKTFILFLFLFAQTLLANTEQSNPSKTSWEIETDPLAWALGGGSMHLAFAWKSQRFQVGLATLEIPKEMQEHNELSESFDALSFKWDYFWNQKLTQGFFTGATADILALRYEETSNKTEKIRTGVGIRSGYKYHPFKNSETWKALYFTPWVGVSYFINHSEIEIENRVYKLNPIKVFPTIHVGWSF